MWFIRSMFWTVVLAIGASLIATLLLDGPFGADGPATSLANPPAYLMTADRAKIGVVLLLAIGGIMYMFGIGFHGRERPRARETARPVEPKLVILEEVSAVRRRISTSIIKLRAMPVDTVPAETKIDLEAIRNSHLPDLEQAHRTARRMHPDDGPEAETLDRDLTASLELIATRLEEMIEECGREARSDFATQRRFIALRHPATAENPLALPQVKMVDASV